MTRDDIIKMAREAGFNPVSYMGANLESFERFAALVAAHEREACANLLLNVDLSSMDADHRLQRWTATVLLNFSDAIRARGER
jgi:Mg-chelatase subunit ChlD